MRCVKHKRVACPDCKKAALTVDPYLDSGLWMTAAQNEAILASTDTSTSWLDSGFSYSSDSSC